MAKLLEAICSSMIASCLVISFSWLTRAFVFGLGYFYLIYSVIVSSDALSNPFIAKNDI